jgi:hypothetical protein
VVQTVGKYDGHGGASPVWCPSRYRAEAELGAGNELTAERVLAALRLARTGRVIELSHILDADVPAYPPRSGSSTTVLVVSAIST